MKRTAISDMSPEQERDELIMLPIKNMIQKAKRAYEKAQEAERVVFQALEAMRIDLDAPTEAENADNLGEAVTCYLCYGEYSLAGLLAEIRAQHTKEAAKDGPPKD